MPNQTSETQTTIYSVSEANRLARSVLEQNFSGICIEGEISELLQHRSGHWYFTLKDEQSQLRVAMFRGANSRVTFKPANGQQVLLKGQLSIYEARGSYQFIASSMLPAGEGKLQREFELLKQKLAAEGLFEQSYKKPLPTLPRQVALVTSPQGAALKDILTVFRRRHAGIELIIVPVAVQGETAAGHIARAIKQVNDLASGSTLPTFNPDAIIVGRGGGSLEDLWAFNEEIVARAIFASKIPVVSAVGHETDFSIADFVADIRAATPSAAAELLSPDSRYLHEKYTTLLRQLTHLISRKITHQRLILSNTANQLQHPAAKLSQYAMSLDHLDTRLYNALSDHLKNKQAELAGQTHLLYSNSPALKLATLKAETGHLTDKLTSLISNTLANLKNQLERNAVALNIVSPLATLERGYSITYNNVGEITQSVKQVVPGEKIKTRLSDGVLIASVEETRSP